MTNQEFQSNFANAVVYRTGYSDGLNIVTFKGDFNGVKFNVEYTFKGSIAMEIFKSVESVTMKTLNDYGSVTNFKVL